jgi:hypothetical protein
MVETRMAENTASSALPDFAALAAAFIEMQAPRLAFQQFFDGYLATLPTQMASGNRGRLGLSRSSMRCSSATAPWRPEVLHLIRR